MVGLLQTTIKAERTGNFPLHLSAVSMMFPFFAASGHRLYAKSARLYLQQMMHLSETHPDVYKDFMAGHHVIRRSQRFWAGMSCDLTIEQTLMCSLKSAGRLTRGRGMGELQRLVWLLSMPSCAAVNQWMVSFTHGASKIEHHKDLTEALQRCRQQRKDDKDTGTKLRYVLQRNPFETEGYQLVCIATGQTSDTSANVDSAKEIGHRILQSMKGQPVSAVSFKKRKEAVTMSTKPAVKIGGERVSVDPQLLFQRLLHVAGGDLSKLEEIFKHELTALSYWQSTCGMPVKVASSKCLRTEDAHYILDGGSLIHQLSWLRGTSYKHLAERYAEYVKRSYPHAIVVFDGYFGGPSTKDMAHVQRSTLPGRDVQFTPDMLLSEKKEEFLSNTTNKQRFIHLVGRCLEENGIPVQHAQGDADCVIVQVALRSTMKYVTVLVGEDTDLLLLRLFMSSQTWRMCSSPQPRQVQQDAGRSKERRAASVPMCARISYLRMHLVAATPLLGLSVSENLSLWRDCNKGTNCLKMVPRFSCGLIRTSRWLQRQERNC